MIRRLRTLLTAGAIYYFVRNYGFQIVPVRAPGMEPLLRARDWLVIDRFSRSLHPLRRNDVVLLWCPSEPSRTEIRRVSALAGDRMPIPPGVVPRGYVFVLADHEQDSQDSREWGPVPERYVLGRVALRFWPPDRLEFF